jgi:carboxynorspermidine decarboxylase
MKFDHIPSPCFVLEEAKLEANLKLLEPVQQGADVDIIIAFKGFAMWQTFSLIKKYLKGASASSLNEVRLCFEKMNCKAHTYAVAYKESEIEKILDQSSHITFNSLAQFDKYGKVAQTKNVSCGLRINPEKSDVSTELYNPSSPQSRLGITADQFPDNLPENIEGLHFHVLCESDSYALENVLKAVEEKFGKHLHKIRWMNLGGGHLITRNNYDVEHLIKVLKAFKNKHNLELILEPGSAIAWQTGVLKTTILDIVEAGSVKTAIIDASFTCHMPDCLEMPYRPTITGANENRNDSEHQYRIGGISCLAGDFLEAYAFEKELNVGDEVIFEDMMHYTMVKTSTFNGIPHPSIGVIKESGEFELIKEFGYDSYKDKLS